MELENNNIKSTKVIFIVPFWYENNKTKTACSPFLIPQINDLSSLLIQHRIVFLESGLGVKKIYDNYKKLRNLLINVDSDEIIYSMYGSFHGFLVWLLLRNHYKIINSFGGSDLLGSTNVGWFWKIKDFITKNLSLILAKNIDHIIVKSQNLKCILNDKVLTPVSVIPNGVNLNVFKPIVNRSKIRHQLGYSENEFIILFNLRRKNSKSESVKNYKLAAKVVSELDKIINLNVKLVLISESTHEEINRLFNAANCLLLTSFHEGSPNIIKEAMATNLPIVSVNCGDVKQRLEFTTNSFVSKSYDAVELSNYCNKIFLNRKRSNGRDELIRQELDNVSVAKKISLIFNSVK